MTIPALDQYLAIDCEMVSVHRAVALAKIGIVNHALEVVYESYVYVNPKNVVDWCTSSSGIRPGDLDNAPLLKDVTAKVKQLVEGKIIVGHAVFNDLAAIQHRHPYENVRDTALYYPLRKLPNVKVTSEGQYPSLKVLCREVLGVKEGEFQKGEHCPVEDARATMEIFLKVREEYEQSLMRDEEVVAGIPAHYEKWYW